MRFDPSSRPNARAEAPRARGAPAKEPGREAIELETERFARRVCRRYARAFTHANAKATKEEVIRQIRITLPPHPGRPRQARVTRACELKRQGVAWREIYAQCIPGYAALKWKERRLEIARLRNAVRARRHSRRRRPRKNSSLISNNEKNNRSLFAPVAPATVIG